MTEAEKDELLAVLLKGDENNPPEILLGRIGAGEGVLSYGLLVEGIVRHKAARPRAAVLLELYLAAQ